MRQLSLIVMLLCTLFSCSEEVPDKPAVAESTRGLSCEPYLQNTEPDSEGMRTIEIIEAEISPEGSLPISEAEHMKIGADFYIAWCSVCDLPIEASKRLN